MLSYTKRRNLYGKLTNDTTTANLSLGDDLMNEEEKKIINSYAWDFIERTETATTVANTQFYNLPYNYRKLIGKPYITVGGTNYLPKEVPSRSFWDRLNETGQSSDIPEWFIIFNKQIGFYPKPASSGNTITYPYEIMPKDLSVADYTTGNITDIANDDTTVTGSGTSWTGAMAGRWLKIDDEDGDGEWYEIASVTNGTTLELKLAYQGTTISGGSASYTIAQMTILPEGYHTLPVYKAAEIYWLENGDMNKSDRFKRLFDEGLAGMKKDRGMKTSNPASDDYEEPMKNPNLHIRL